MSKKYHLNPQEAEFIRNRSKEIASILDAISKATKFKEGDFLIAFEPDRWSGSNKRRLITNSYGAAKKYTVVHVDSNGIAYIKELNKKGNPVGQLISTIHFDGGFRSARDEQIEFEVDPDFTDAIIMSDEDNYDAAMIQRMKSDLFKEITEHNKSLKINCHDQQELIKFLQSLKVGDVIYKSIKTHFTILNIDPIPTTHNGTRLTDGKVFGKAQNSKGKIFDIDSRTFKWSAIYKGQPRSYNELKDPK